MSSMIKNDIEWIENLDVALSKLKEMPENDRLDKAYKLKLLHKLVDNINNGLMGFSEMDFLYLFSDEELKRFSDQYIDVLEKYIKLFNDLGLFLNERNKKIEEKEEDSRKRGRSNFLSI